MAIYFASAIFLLCCFGFVNCFNMLGPVDIVFKKFDDCDPPLREIDFWVKQTKYNRTVYLLDINLDTPFDIDDSVIMELNGSIKKEGGYKPGAFYLKKGACDGVKKMLGKTFRDVLKAAGRDDCPLPAGHHEALNYYFDNSQFVVPQLYGEYKLQISLFKDDVLKTCLYAYYEAVPKNSK